MTTYNVIASTNPYIASRDIHFNGKTRIIISENITEDEAKNKLLDIMLQKYDAIKINTKDEYLKEYSYPVISEQADSIGVSESGYFETHKKMLFVLYAHKSGHFETFEGSGYYDNSGGSLVLVLSDNSKCFEWDSRFYSIEECQ